MAVGKLVRGALYVHREAVAALGDEGREKVARAIDIAGNVRWNVFRIQGEVVALLDYEKFEDSAFPRLLASMRVDLETGAKAATDFTRSDNPLILHRKELLVARRDEQTARWAETTRRLMELGLFRDGNVIGREKAWRTRLAAAGLAIVGDEVVPA